MYLFRNCQTLVLHCGLSVAVCIVMPPPLTGGGIKRWCCLTSGVCLSEAYIRPKSRTERPRKTKIGTEVAHVTRDTICKVKKSRSPGRFTHRSLNAWGRCSGDRENVLGVGNYCYVASARRRARRWGPHGRGEGRGHIVSPRAELVYFSLQNIQYEKAVNVSCTDLAKQYPIVL